jgi:hypothetical protein
MQNSPNNLEKLRMCKTNGRKIKFYLSNKISTPFTRLAKIFKMHMIMPAFLNFKVLQAKIKLFKIMLDNMKFRLKRHLMICMIN